MLAAWARRTSIFIQSFQGLLDGTGSLRGHGDVSPLTSSDEEGGGDTSPLALHQETEPPSAAAGGGGGRPGEAAVDVGAGVAAGDASVGGPACTATGAGGDAPDADGSHLGGVHSDDSSTEESSAVPPQFGIVEPGLFRGT
jgi:hypothetical protein